MIGYKVLCTNTNTGVFPPSIRLEGMLLNYHNGTCLEYKQGTKTVPIIPNSKLFCFRNYDDAVAFTFSSEHQIWKCIAENPRPIKYMHPVLAMRETQSCIDFWKYRSKYQSKNTVPHGTYQADSITLLERVQ